MPMHKALWNANSYSQAKICFDIIRECLLSLDPTMKKFKVNETKCLVCYQIEVATYAVCQQTQKAWWIEC